MELRRLPAFCNVFWRVRSCSVVLEEASAVTVLARGDVLTAWSEEGGGGTEGRSVGERRKNFLRMPKEPSESCGGEVKVEGCEDTFGSLG